MSPQPPPRKKLRKGTKSCLECRRRKVRCTYEEHDGIPPCDGCVSRSTACEAQERVEDLGQIREPMRERVDRLEATVKSLSDRLEETVKSLTESVAELQSSRVVSEKTTVAPCRTEEYAASGYGYFESMQDEDAEIDFGGCDDQAETSKQRMLLNRERLLETTPNDFNDSLRDRMRAQLTSAIPSRGDLLVLTASSIDWWQIHSSLLPEPPIKSRIDLIERHEGLSNPSTHPARIATWLLCLAITFLQLPTDFDYSALESMAEPTSFVPRTVKQVEDMLAKDDLAETLEGIECACVFAQIQKFIGRPKKGWLVIRRAIAFAELLKLPASKSALLQLKKKGHAAQDEHYALLKRKYHAWTSLHALDRLLCLLLGTPTARSGITPDFSPSDPHASTKRIVWVQSEIHNQIVARDTTHLPESEIFTDETRKILQQCQALARTFPPKWKAVDRWTGYDSQTASSVMMQSGHSYLVLRATLPCLLAADGDGGTKEEFVRACLQSCHEILRRYFAVRTRLLNGTFLSRSFECHAFTAGVVLLLYGDKFWQNPLGDTALLENVKAAMQRAPGGDMGRMVGCLEALQRFVEGEVSAPGLLRVRMPILGGVEVGRGERGEVRVLSLDENCEEEGAWDFDALDEEGF